MARLPRLVLPNHPHHIIQEGNDRQQIFRDDEDYQRFLGWLKDSARAQYVSVSDEEALQAFHDCCRIEGIIPALESAHALAYAAKLAATLPKDKLVLANLSGRGDKDMHTVAEKMGLDFS